MSSHEASTFHGAQAAGKTKAELTPAERQAMRMAAQARQEATGEVACRKGRCACAAVGWSLTPGLLETTPGLLGNCT